MQPAKLTLEAHVWLKCSALKTSMRHAGIALFLLLAAVPSVAQPPASGAHTVDEPMVMLVARPELSDPFYRRTVLLVIPIGNERHSGFILNRSTRLPLSSFFPKYDPAKKVIDPVYLGGPMAERTLFALVRTATDPGGGSIHLMNGLFVVARADVVDHIVASTPNDAPYYVGYVEWQPGELRSELFRRWWFVLSPDMATIFSANAEKVWEELIRRALLIRAERRSPWPAEFMDRRFPPRSGPTTIEQRGSTRPSSMVANAIAAERDLLQTGDLSPYRSTDGGTCWYGVTVNQNFCIHFAGGAYDVQAHLDPH